MTPLRVFGVLSLEAPSNVGWCPPYRKGGVVRFNVERFAINCFRGATKHTELVWVDKAGAVGMDANSLWNSCAELTQTPTSLLGDGVYILDRLKGLVRATLVGVVRQCQRP
eukprot:1236939-Prymnesium_polylepis.1